MNESRMVEFRRLLVRTCGRYLVLLGLGTAFGCSGSAEEPYDRVESPIIYHDVSQIEFEQATSNAQEWATAVGLMLPTSSIDRRRGDGTLKNCPDKTQSSFECTAVLDTFASALCSGETWSTQLRTATPMCTAFMIKNDPGSPAVFATAGHCITPSSDCSNTSVVLRWRRSLPSFPGGNPNVLEQHIYQCTQVLAHGGHTDASLTNGQDWAVFEVDRYVTGGGATGGPLTPDREALPIGSVGPVEGGAGTTMGYPVAHPIKIDPEVLYASLATNRGPGTFYAFADAMAGQSGSPFLNAAGEVVGILTGAVGPIQDGSCFRQCFATGEGQHQCSPLPGLSAANPHAFSTIGVNISQIPSEFRASAEHVMILLDQTGSMSAAGLAAGSSRWDDAVNAAIQWVQFDKATAGFVDRAYSIWTFKNDTVLGGTQNGALQIWPEPGSSDCPEYEPSTGFCRLPRSGALDPPGYDALQQRLGQVRETHRAVAGPNTPLAQSVCDSLEVLRSIGGVKRIILQADGGENSSPLTHACFGDASEPFEDWNVDLTLRELPDWGMTLDSWQAKVVRRATRLDAPLATAVGSPLTVFDWFPFELVWHVDLHYAVTEPDPGMAAASAFSARDELELVDAPFAVRSLPVGTATLAASGYDIDEAERLLFSGLGRSSSRSTLRSYVWEPGAVFGVDRAVSGDVNLDGCVDGADLCQLYRPDVWAHRSAAPNTAALQADLNRDGWADDRDSDLLLANWGGGCTNSGPFPDLEQAVAACDAAFAKRWLSFEDPARPWVVTVGSAFAQPTASEASHLAQALAISGCDYALLDSPPFHTDELPAGGRLALDVKVPSLQENPNWQGDVQAHITIPGAGIFNAWLGWQALTPLATGAWHTLEFELPAHVRTGLDGSFASAQIHLALNTGNCAGAPAFIDHVRVSP